MKLNYFVRKILKKIYYFYGPVGDLTKLFIPYLKTTLLLIINDYL